MYFCRIPTFQTTLLPPLQDEVMEAEDPLKCWYPAKVHGITI